ncbi:Gfo/Idh/MocA family protein [Echinicola shivajiensis]|uniref:Gfo/Idh/MocA family protein n=1 Tax=Echinicola shivajiensis TaxID=1035916 RepID=UPI001BFC5842|nr:Gfo/Idh/MocA family oxidoreductase [Echinicola shivajiensis]
MSHNRRIFLKGLASVGVGLSIIQSPKLGLAQQLEDLPKGKRVGIIGLDTSHSLAFTKAFNSPNPDPSIKGYRVVAAYPYGSKTIESSAKRIPGYIKEIKEYGVKIVNSIDSLLDQVDVVLLETNDGRLHFEQALPVIKAGKKLFIDKPIAASLSDAKAIFEAADKNGVPIFSSSSLRYVKNIPDIVSGKLIGNITGVDTYSPAIIEPTHPDLFWYGIHGVEMLFTIMGPGCMQVSRVHTQDTDMVVGIWKDDRIGTFRGIRRGKHAFGGIAFGEKGQVAISPYEGYLPLLYQIAEFFDSGVPPVNPIQTLEILAFMEAADESKKLGGQSVSIPQLT